MSVKKQSDDELFGYKRREQRREEQKKDALVEAEFICQKLWESFLKNFKVERSEVSEESIYQLYEDTYKQFEESKYISIGLMPVALTKRLFFFNNINRERKRRGLEPLPAPTVAYQPQRPKNTALRDAFFYLPKLQNIMNEAVQTWQTKNSFSLVDGLAWLMFSLLMHGRIHSVDVLNAFYVHITTKKQLYRLADDMVYIPLDVVSKTYGNQIIHIKGSDEKIISYSKWVFIDDISRLWLIKVNQLLEDEKSKIPSFYSCVRQLGNLIGQKFKADNLEKTDFFSYLNIYWQTLSNVHIDQQLVELLVHHDTHTAISLKDWQAYLGAPQESDTTTVKNEYITVNRLNKTTQNLQDEVVGIEDSVSKDKTHKNVLKDIRRALMGSRKKIKEQLEALTEIHEGSSERVLILWMLDLNAINKAISTLLRYLTEVGEAFLYGTRDEDITDYRVHQYEFLYDSIIAKKNTLNIGYTQTVLNSIHQSLKKHLGAPHVHLQRENDPKIVSSSLISPDLYKHIIRSVSKQIALSSYNKSMMKVIFTLLYRTGLRINELLGIRLTDIEYDRDTYSDINLIIRSNSHRTLKSDDGTRRITLSVLLKPGEFKELQAYFIERTRHKKEGKYLFALEGLSTPLDRGSVDRVFKEVIGPHYQHLVLHSFRHNALSNMAVILRCRQKVLDIFTDYTEDEVQRIKADLLGKMRIKSGHHWDALMEFAGHADLDTTFSSYIHTVDIISAHLLDQAYMQLPVGVVTKLTNKARRSFNQHNPQALDFETNSVDLTKIREFINRELNIKKIDNSKQYFPTSRIEDEGVSVSPIFGKYARWQIEEFLSEIEAGKVVSEAAQHHFVYEDAVELYNRALLLAADGNGKPDYKLISKYKQPKSGHVLIAPTLPTIVKEQQLVQECFIKLESLYLDQSMKKSVQSTLSTFYKKANSSHSDLRFKFNEKQMFYDYLDIAIKILPARYWRINISAYQMKRTTKPKKGELKYQKIMNEEKQLEIMKEFKADYRKLSKNITNNDFYSGYSLSVINPKENEIINSTNNEATRASSSLMKYVMHLLLIVDVSFELDR
ncbi:site-specific integrase [Psychrobacter sp. FME13]|uniref:site-specific integrase n=1 Tax=Psychrobacter sp. FME13 TaxID=2487708 RepID=UPI0017877DBC|nr:site-specific integrase [Psychrobacter sp. FME13]MBE0441234.1 site-specific integrase [Psychrobacter sp. FME13]